MRVFGIVFSQIISHTIFLMPIYSSFSYECYNMYKQFSVIDTLHISNFLVLSNAVISIPLAKALLASLFRIDFFKAEVQHV